MQIFEKVNLHAPKSDTCLKAIEAIAAAVYFPTPGNSFISDSALSGITLFNS